jgi:hypothetical protein
MVSLELKDPSDVAIYQKVKQSRLHSIFLHADVPVLIKYEIDNDAIILEPSEYQGLRSLCAQNPDLELDSKDIFSFLRYLHLLKKGTG